MREFFSNTRKKEEKRETFYITYRNRRVLRGRKANILNLHSN